LVEEPFGELGERDRRSVPVTHLDPGKLGVQEGAGFAFRADGCG
jgi:hypothetical protein